MMKSAFESTLKQERKFYLPIAILFIFFLLLANITAQKILPIGKIAILTVGDFIFPLVYIADNILTEIYGYAASRRVIWIALGINISFALLIAVLSPSIKVEVGYFSQHFLWFFDRVPQIVFASFIAFLIGEFTNSYVLAKLKIFTAGKFLWLRALGSLSLGQGLDSIFFVCIAFIGVLSWRNIFIMGVSVFCFKILYEILTMPAICFLMRFLKREEGIDVYDFGANFSPFSF